jgi:diguanylate cyclase (GGDEF)-like protein
MSSVRGAHAAVRQPTTERPVALAGRGRSLRAVAFRTLTPHQAHVAGTTLILLTATGLAAEIIRLDASFDVSRVHWVMFAAVALCHLVGEYSTKCWIRAAELGVVTPRWATLFAVLLVSTPLLTLVVGSLGVIVTSRRHAETGLVALARFGSTVAAITLAGLILPLSGINGSITQFATITWTTACAIVAVGIALLVVTACLGAFRDWAYRSTPLEIALARQFRGHVAADGALLSLAPIWVVGAAFNAVLVPLLTATSIFIFRSTRQGFDRAQDALNDPLTGLLNSKSFRHDIDELYQDRIVRFGAAVILIDLDGFKEVNDQLGHEVGDQVLVSFAARLRSVFPTSALLCRLGGDEFAAVPILHRFSEQFGEAEVRRIHELLTQPLDVRGFPICIGVSLGVAVGSPNLASSEELLRAADTAMYRAKRLRTGVEFHDSAQYGHGRIHLLTDLGHALVDHQLTVHFQPQVEMTTGRIDAVEALIRWHHPELGDIPPDEFIGLAEQTDLIAPITDFVIRLAATGVMASGVDDVRLAVNVSARSLLDRHFADHVLETLADLGFPPNRLEVEVTERAIVSNSERSCFTIQRLRDAGVHIAIDDFGAGYSSYQTLRHLDVDRVKIDKSFVTGMLEDPRAEAIVLSVVNLAHQLSIDVVAEGVETTELWEALVAMGCDTAQGYGISRPMSLPDLRGWMTRWNEIRYEQIEQFEPVNP